MQPANGTPGDPQPHGETGNKQDKWADHRHAGSSQCSAQKNPSTEEGKGHGAGEGGGQMAILNRGAGWASLRR